MSEAPLDRRLMAALALACTLAPLGSTSLAVALPSGITPSGLPTGATLFAPAWHDLLVARVAGIKVNVQQHLVVLVHRDLVVQWPVVVTSVLVSLLRQ